MHRAVLIRPGRLNRPLKLLTGVPPRFLSTKLWEPLAATVILTANRAYFADCVMGFN